MTVNLESNEEGLMAVENELQQAATDKQLLARWAKLEKLRITPEMEIPPMEFLFEMFHKPCFPRGELVAVTGKAKSGKTFLSSILMALCFQEKVLGVRRLTPPLHALWFDTEQSDESTQDILRNRIMRLARANPSEDTPSVFGEDSIPPGMFDVFNVRCAFWQERLPLLEAAIGKFQPDLVMLDGIRDLVDDINDGAKAQNILERLMNLASKWHCCIVCILHQNKAQEDRSMRGWMGTELKNKAFETYECSKKEGIFSVKQLDSRKQEIADLLQFSVDERGLPRMLTEQEVRSGTATTGNAPSAESVVRPTFNERYVLERKQNFVTFDLRLLFGDALAGCTSVEDIKLRDRVMEMACMTSPNLYYSVLKKAIKEGIVSQSFDSYNRPLYSLA